MKTKSLERISLYLSFQNQSWDIRQLISTLDSSISQQKLETSHRISTDPYINARIQVNRYYQLKTLFPSILWASILLTVYSLLEHALEDYCDIVQREKSLLVGQVDLKDRGIKRAEKYLTKVAQVPFPSRIKDWQNIRNANTVRNCLSHAAGVLKDSSDEIKLRQIIKQDKRLEIVEGKLVLSKQYVIDFVSSAITIIVKLTGSAGLSIKYYRGCAHPSERTQYIRDSRNEIYCRFVHTTYK